MTKLALKLVIAVAFSSFACLVLGQVSNTPIFLAPRLVTVNANTTPSKTPQTVSIIDFSGNQVNLANTIVTANASTYPKGAHAYLLYAGSTVVPMGTPSPVFCRVGTFEAGVSVQIDGQGRTLQNVLYLFNPPSGDFASAWEFTTPVMAFDHVYYQNGLSFYYFINRNVKEARLQVSFPGDNNTDPQFPWTSIVTMFPGTQYRNTDSVTVHMLGDYMNASIIGNLPGMTNNQIRWVIKFEGLGFNPVAAERAYVYFHAG